MNKKQKGINLIELILFIVIVSTALASILLVMNTTERGSVDPMLHKQTLAIAESLLEEIELQDFLNIACDVGCKGDVSQRNNFDDMFDYDGIVTTADVVTGVSTLVSYSVSVTVVNPAADWGTVPAASVAEIEVSVTAPNGESLSALGYRVDY
ncbi:MAG: hypothetical protein WAX77_02960 [Methylococcaceae bacterium]